MVFLIRVVFLSLFCFDSSCLYSLQSNPISTIFVVYMCLDAAVSWSATITVRPLLRFQERRADHHGCSPRGLGLLCLPGHQRGRKCADQGTAGGGGRWDLLWCLGSCLSLPEVFTPHLQLMRGSVLNCLVGAHAGWAMTLMFFVQLVNNRFMIFTADCFTPAWLLKCFAFIQLALCCSCFCSPARSFRSHSSNHSARPGQPDRLPGCDGAAALSRGQGYFSEDLMGEGRRETSGK